MALLPPVDSSGSESSDDEDELHKKKTSSSSNFEIRQINYANNFHFSITDLQNEIVNTAESSSCSQDNLDHTEDAVMEPCLDLSTPPSHMSSNMGSETINTASLNYSALDHSSDFDLYVQIGEDQDTNTNELNSTETLNTSLLSHQDVSVTPSSSLNVSTTSVPSLHHPSLDMPSLSPVPILPTREPGSTQSASRRNTRKKKSVCPKKGLKPKTKTKVRKPDYKWTNGPFSSRITDVPHNNAIPGPSAGVPGPGPGPSPAPVLEPIAYFYKMFTMLALHHIVEQTNLYSCQTKSQPIDINILELQNFIGILITMSIVSMPAYTDYWSNACRFETIATVMPLKRFQKIRKYLHFADNSSNGGTDDRYFKIRPLLDIIRSSFLSIEEEGKYSIDEMMIPYKGKRAGSRKQYIKNKPCKWGFKVFIRAGISGMIYDFLIYGGESTFRNISFSPLERLMGFGAKVVLALCQSIKKQTCAFIFCDNFFSSLELFTLLREKYGILSLGTIRSNRIRNCPLMSDKVLGKKGRGSYDLKVSEKQKVCIVKWFDNKSVCLASSFCEAEPLGTVKRFIKNQVNQTSQAVGNAGCHFKSRITCPDIVKKYNAFMGGVDLVDMLIALYRTPFRTHRWYMSIFSQLIDMCLTNAWLMYRRDCAKNNIRKTMRLKVFKLSVAKVLMSKGKRYTCPTEKQANVIVHSRANTEDAIRYDGIEHLPKATSKGRCRFCTIGQCRMACIKCDVRLCVTQDKNCYFQYHNK